MGKESKHFYEFGPFRVDPDRLQLLRDNRPLALPPKAFETLLVLVRHSEALISKDDLMKSVWPDTFVEESNLAQNIFVLRKTLGDGAGENRYIVTVPGRGYRFTEKVRLVPEQEEIVVQSHSISRVVIDEQSLPRKSWRWAAVVAVAVAALVGGAWFWHSHELSEQSVVLPTVRSLAVLPFENLSNDPSQEYFADGMTDELISELGQIGSVRVVSRTSVMQFKHSHRSLPQIANELKVDAVVEGTVLKSGDQVRITAQLIQAATDRHLWSQSYQAELRNVLGLQNQMALAIADQIRAKLTSKQQASLTSNQSVDPEAYEAYLKGLYFWNKRDGGGLKKAVEYFQQAIQKDPNYAVAYAGLADSYVLLADEGVSQEEITTAAKVAAQRALSLNPNLADAHTALGLIFEHDWDFPEAEREYKLGVSLGPNYATAHDWYGEAFLMIMGRFEEANREMAQARALDPVSRVIATDWGITLYFEGRYDEAYRELSKVIDLDPNFSQALMYRGLALLQQAKYDEAIKDLRRAADIDNSPYRLSHLAFGLGRVGRKIEAQSILRDLEDRSKTSYVSPYYFAMVYAGLGDEDRAFAWLEKAFEERSVHVLAMKACPHHDVLRQDARFAALLARVGFPN